MEYILSSASGDASGWAKLLSIGIALATNFGAIWMFVVSAIWWVKLKRESDSDFANWFLGTAVVMLSIWYWSFTGVMQILYLDITPPNFTLPARVAMLVGVWIKVWKTTHRRQNGERTAMAFRNDLRKELTHLHTPELDDLLKRVDSLTAEEIEKKLLPMLLERVEALKGLINVSERDAAVMFPMVMRREKRERELRLRREGKLK